MAIPLVLFAFDLLVGATSQAGGCAAFGEAINLVMANMVITFLTWMTCGIELLRGRRSALLSLGLVLNFAWILPLLLVFGPSGS